MSWTQSQYNYNNGSYSDSPRYQYFKMMATVTESVDVANNRSTLTVAVSLYHASISCVANTNSVAVKWVGTNGSATGTINGTTLSSPAMNRTSTTPTTTSFGSSTIVVPHNSSGTASGYVTVEWTKSITYHDQSYTELGCKVPSITLTPIIQTSGAYITYVTDFTSESNPQVQYINPMGSSVSTLQVCIAEDAQGSSLLASYRDCSKTGTSYTFSLTSSERNAIIALAGAERTATVYFILKTIVSGDYYYDADYSTFTMDVEEEAPEIYEPYKLIENSNIPSSIRSRFTNLLVQGKSDIVMKVMAAAQGDATIEGYNSVVDGVVYTEEQFRTSVFSTAGTKSWAITVVDSRGYTNSITGTLDVLPYTKPTMSNVEVYRSDAAGVFDKNSTQIWIRATRVVSPITSSGVRKNYSTMSYRYKLTSEQSFGSWTTLLGSESSYGDTYSALISGTFPTSNSYLFQIRVVDDMGETTVIQYNTASDIIALHLGNTGRAIGIGRYADTNIPRSLSVGWKTYFDDTVYLLVNGSYITLAQYIQSFISNS